MYFCCFTHFDCFSRIVRRLDIWEERRRDKSSKSLSNSIPHGLEISWTILRRLEISFSIREDVSCLVSVRVFLKAFWSGLKVSSVA